MEKEEKKVEKKRRKDQKQEIRPDPPEDSCHFYIQKKKRFCRFKPAPGANYCAEHAGFLNIATDKKRIPCPYDSKHTCYESKLTHHLKRCPSRPRDMPAYYSPGINAGDDAGENVPDPKVTVITVPIEEVQAMIDKVNSLYEEHLKSVEEEILSHSCMQTELDNTTYGTAAMRHRKQQASLIGHMEKIGLLTDNVCYLEMGAGRGQLSHWLHGAVKKCDNIGFLLVDRSHVRYKFDNLHKEEGSGHVMKRIRIDIEHLNLGNVPGLQKGNQAVVGYGKHLCGGATDLALRCMIETLRDDTETDSGETESKRPKTNNTSLKGTVIALCCHHRCTWKPYVGKTFFRSCGLTAQDFQLMSSMSSWATCTWKGWSHSRKSEKSENLKSDKEDAGKPMDSTLGENNSGEKILIDANISNDSLSDDSQKGEKGQGEPPKSANTGTVSKEGDNEVQTVDKTVGVVLKKDEKRTEEEVAALQDKVPGVNKDGVDSDEDVEHQQDNTMIHTNTGLITKLTEEEREEVGRKCKRLIDYGRVKYLEEHGLISCLKSYIEEFFTPENVLMLSHRV